MKRLIISSLLLSVLACMTPIVSRAQQSTSTPSLGELARELKAKKAKEKEKEKAKLFTNDNLPGRVAGHPLSVAGEMSETPSGEKAGKQGEKPAGAEGQAEGGSANQAHDEKYYRGQMAKLQDRLNLDQRELNIMQQKLGLNQTQYYSDPQKTLTEEYTRSDINKLQQQIDKKKQQVADDQQAIENLREQLRREGGDPGWLR
jgi:hypothetical protein